MNKQGDDRLFLECERWRVFAVLMVAAGFLGAFTYTLRGGVFCNAQTGNFLLMAIELADGNLRRAAYYLIPIAAYFFGAVVSELMPIGLHRVGRIRWDTLLVGIEAAVLALLGLLPESAPYPLSQVTITFLCSMQYNTFRQARGVPMATTFCTNNLRQAAIHLVRWLRKKDDDSRFRHFSYLGILLMFVLGAAAGTVLCRLFAGRAVWGAALLLLLLFADLLHADLVREKHLIDRKPRGH